jgi:hypothetical protein
VHLTAVAVMICLAVMMLGVADRKSKRLIKIEKKEKTRVRFFRFVFACDGGRMFDSASTSDTDEGGCQMSNLSIFYPPPNISFNQT